MCMFFPAMFLRVVWLCGRGMRTIWTEKYDTPMLHIWWCSREAWARDRFVEFDHSFCHHMPLHVLKTATTENAHLQKRKGRRSTWLLQVGSAISFRLTLRPIVLFQKCFCWNSVHMVAACNFEFRMHVSAHMPVFPSTLIPILASKLPQVLLLVQQPVRASGHLKGWQIFSSKRCWNTRPQTAEICSYKRLKHADSCWNMQFLLTIPILAET